MEKEELESLLDGFRHNPYKVLFGTEAKRKIGRRYILNPDGEMNLEDLKGNEDLMKSINEFIALDILAKREEDGTTSYRIKDSEMGERYKQIIKGVASMMVLATEKVEELNGVELSKYL